MSKNLQAGPGNEALPVGGNVPGIPAEPPVRRALSGRMVTLNPLDAEADAAELFEVSHGSKEARRVWTYLFQGPFSDEEAMKRWLGKVQDSNDPLFFTVIEAARGRCVGMVSFLNMVPAMRRLELGNIWYAPFAQRTRVNTEAIYLMMTYAFDDLGYRRVEWKCDSLNRRSRQAALRLGFEYEGTFKQHMVVKGRNRDTSWYAVLDRDWQSLKRNLRHWLYEAGEPRRSLAEMNRCLRANGGV
ncbi:MAG: GNAT family protein [Acidobacteriota bacterium]